MWRCRALRRPRQSQEKNKLPDAKNASFHSQSKIRKKMHHRRPLMQPPASLHSPWVCIRLNTNNGGPPSNISNPHYTLPSNKLPPFLFHSEPGFTGASSRGMLGRPALQDSGISASEPSIGRFLDRSGAVDGRSGGRCWDGAWARFDTWGERWLILGMAS